MSVECARTLCGKRSEIVSRSVSVPVTRLHVPPFRVALLVVFGVDKHRLIFSQ